MLQGRDFSPQMATDSAAMVINHAAAKAIGLRNIVGTNVKFFGMPYHIIGISADMVSNSPADTVEPAIFLGGRYTGKYIIHINPRLSAQTSLAGMQPISKHTIHPAPSSNNFVDDDYSAKFKSAENIGNLASIFTALAIFISCLGLFGLASFIAERRTREIDIRKVLGAPSSAFGMLSKEFPALLVLSFLIAIPLSAWGMEKLCINTPTAPHVLVDLRRRLRRHPPDHPRHRQLPGPPRRPDQPHQKPPQRMTRQIA